MCLLLVFQCLSSLFFSFVLPLCIWFIVPMYLLLAPATSSAAFIKNKDKELQREIGNSAMNFWTFFVFVIFRNEMNVKSEPLIITEFVSKSICEYGHAPQIRIYYHLNLSISYNTHMRLVFHFIITRL